MFFMSDEERGRYDREQRQPGKPQLRPGSQALLAGRPTAACVAFRLLSEATRQPR